MTNFDLPMNLQFFAEDSGDGDGGATETNQSPNGGEQQPTGDDSPHKEANPDDGADDSKPKVPEGYHSDKEVDEIIKQKWAKWKAKDDEAKKMAKMDAEQKAQYQLEQLQKENEELKGYKSKSQMTKTAIKMAGEAGVNLTDDDLSHIVTTEADSTKANLDWLKGLKDRISEQVKKDYLSGNAPKASGESLSGKKNNYGAQLAKKTAKPVKNPYFNNQAKK